MDHNVTPLERAFQLARSGICASMADIKGALRIEGYELEHIVGTALNRQLTELIDQARSRRHPDGRTGRRLTSGGATSHDRK